MRRRQYLKTTAVTVTALAVSGCNNDGEQATESPDPQTLTDTTADIETTSEGPQATENTETASPTDTASPTRTTTNGEDTSRISWAEGSGQPFRSNRVETRTQELVEYLNENIDRHTVVYRSRGDVGINAASGKYGPDKTDEKAFVEDALTALEDDQGLHDGEIVALAHSRDLPWGYGRKHRTQVGENNKVVWGALVAAGRLVRDWETDGFTWHEIGHALGAQHREGSIAINSDGMMHAITPMCMSYVKDRNGNSDTQRSASNDRADCFNRRGGGHVHPSEHGYKYTTYGQSDANHELNRYSKETLNKVRAWVEQYPEVLDQIRDSVDSRKKIEQRLENRELRISNDRLQLAKIQDESRSNRPFIQYLEHVTRNGIKHDRPNFESVPYPYGVDAKFKMTCMCGYQEATVDGVRGTTIHRRFASGGHTLDDTTFIGLLPGEPVVVVEQRFINPMEESLRLDTPDDFIAKGVGVGNLGYAPPSGRYRFHVEGSGTERFGAHGKWETFEPDPQRPFVTAFDNDRGITLGVIDSPNGPSIGMTSTLRQGFRLIRLFVNGFDIPPGSTRSLRLAIAPHSGGSEAPEKGGRLVDKARSSF